jgi:hypothetical protein
MVAPGRVFFSMLIMRTDIQANRDKLFAFGDNMERRGNGGQALQFRRERNSVGIPTKWYPAMTKDAFFKDEDFSEVVPEIDAAFARLEIHVARECDIVLPAMPFGSGYARLQQRAPMIYNYIGTRVTKLVMLSGSQPVRADTVEEAIAAANQGELTGVAS